ncbi:MAG: hypothetical protein L0099_03165 [Acidobacteria bacterium]|nr:hypothetical protein [Acidobacteriota bacterium]
MFPKYLRGHFSCGGLHVHDGVADHGAGGQVEGRQVPVARRPQRCAAGLRTVRKLLDAVRSPAPQGKRIKDDETVPHDLEELAGCLRAAAKHGARFRLEVC